MVEILLVRIENIIKRKDDKLYVKCKGYDINLIVGLKKNIFYKFELNTLLNRLEVLEETQQNLI